MLDLDATGSIVDCGRCWWSVDVSLCSWSLSWNWGVLVPWEVPRGGEGGDVSSGSSEREGRMVELEVAVDVDAEG